MVKERKILAIEFTAIVLLWTLVVISPLLFMDDSNQNWVAVHLMWVECVVVGSAFFVNRFLLMPHLFFEKRYVAYIGSIVLLLLFLGLFVLYFDGVNAIMSLFGEGDINADIAHQSMGTPPPQSMGTPPPQGGMGTPPPQGGMGTPPLHQSMGTPPPAMAVTSAIPPTVTVLILAVITIALDMGLRIAVKWIIAEQKQAAINRERIMAQLLNLQSQVSPHFFMNTLNNIHALVDIDSQRAKQTIIELSSLMDYLLYESANKERVLLQRELDFIGSYIHLMRLRFSQQVRVLFSYDKSVPMVDIPPLLFLNFIENAFKYGVDCDKESIIKIHFRFTPTSIEMTTMNNNHSEAVRSERRGLGISNSRKRLDLLYGDRYTLAISDKERIYCVDLKIPLA